MTELDRFLRRPEVEQAIGMTKSMLYKMMAAGQFPKPIKIGRGSVWSSVEVAEWQKRLRDTDRILVEIP